MGLMSTKERNDFRISISSKPLPKLMDLFNKLSKDHDNERLSDHSRGVAGEKASMVKSEMVIRRSGGCSG